ncbi:unnamed protein product [Musa hybrid cultivar]
MESRMEEKRRRAMEGAQPAVTLQGRKVAIQPHLCFCPHEKVDPGIQVNVHT